MERKMADRRTIRLSQLPERLAREKLEDSDWVTFAVLVNKATQKSNNSVGIFIRLFLIWIVEKYISVLSSPKYQNVLLYSVMLLAGKNLQHLEA